MSTCIHRKNVIRALKKLDMSYNTACLNYINYKLKYMVLEYVSDENHLYTNNTLTLACCPHHTEGHTIFKMCDITMRQKNTRLAYVHLK